MGANAVQAGQIINLSSSLDALYLRLYNLRNTHANSTHQLNASNIAAAQQSSGLKIGDPIAISTAKIDLLKQELANLANSQWYQSNTAGTVVKMTDFSNNFSIPNVGDLITASDFNLIENTITIAETITPNYSNKYSSQYTSRYSTCYSSDYSSRYSGRYSSDYSSRYSGQYSSDYSSRYSGQYTTRYSTCYSGRYGSQYTTRYSTCYSGRYGSQYGTCYTSEYSSCYTGRYSTRYGTKYTACYSGRFS